MLLLQCGFARQNPTSSKRLMEVPAFAEKLNVFKDNPPADL